MEGRTSSTNMTDRSSRRYKPEDTISVSSYHDYPSQKPFINSDYRPPITKRPIAQPESNRNAVISALKNLQDKIRKLELERTSAEDNLRALTTETTRYKDMLQKSYQSEGARQSMVSKQTQALESQLTSAETRCKVLEKQLDHMRTMVQEAEHGRHEAIQSAACKAQDKRQASEADQRSHRDQISQLERDRVKLAATQNLAQSKIRALEEQLKRERLQRQYLEEQTLSNGRDPYVHSPPAKTKKVVRKKKKEKTTKPVRRTRTASEPSKHFRLNLAEIPFVAGQSTTPSHRVGANVQKVIALMKSHNVALCSSLQGSSASSSSSRCSTPDSDADLAELLLQLQDEFGEMSFEHHELMKQLNETDNETVRQELEAELDSLVSRMEAKSQQISRVRRHQTNLDCKKRKKKQGRPKSAMARLQTQRNGEVKVTTTIRASGPGSGRIKVKTSPSGKSPLTVLKDMKKLQTSLRRDDVHWDK
ncbi:centrosomal protein of 57 kDa-like [Liolophura sinensis]|uniref:centrosomal protein of 57 kDa-like n=1 Tax=Liolophura sinensis TaxID=3198878 RepID=UPI003158D4CA